MHNEEPDWGRFLLSDRRAHLIQTIRSRDVTLRHLFYEAGAKIAPHRHPKAAIVYGVGGPCIELERQSRIVARRLTYYPQNYLYALQYLGPTHIVAIDFSATRVPTTTQLIDTPLPSQMYTPVWRALTSALDPTFGVEFRDEIESLISAAIKFALRSPTSNVLAIIDELHRSWRKVPRIFDLAERVQISPQHLCRSFKQQTGLTIGQYSSLLKLDYARGLLWGTNMSIAAVAAEAGFSDQSHFNRVLTHHNQVTPRKLRSLAPCVRGGRNALDRRTFQLVREFNPVQKTRR